MTCRESADLGAYVLGALPPAERSALERHVAGCPHCTQELVLLAPLPGLLRHTPFAELPESAAPLPRPPADTGTGTSADRHTRTVARRVLVAAGAALAAAGVVVAVLFGTGGAGGHTDAAGAARPGAPITLSRTDPATHVSASMDLTAESWGTSVRLRLAHLPPGVVCRLVVHSREGRSETSGTWASDYGSGATLTIPASTSISPQDIVGLDVVTAQNSVLVTVP
jgi:hypothetical protein